jgi:hypothetical protein
MDSSARGRSGVEEKKEEKEEVKQEEEKDKLQIVLLLDGI